ncbi:hypothetical protein TREMEDRAFT_65028 [Tremella mesenterica DSM 1558]|uniref:uncharacterized protein n=1 Tax=Tremella mesenterica (strain ATCC 24925 / CBS 8224 / DSM 1558 / NBRC 9311 / NRRL Y-6157 / RJB 2259-6 / UBC 559-6) TaxID=578456 RepID=UPI00032C8EBB|nr:uncharacterized protein TREMEDRAFT_65028 [Tremella mesenterica DSM 1558]EIW66646.1 hypothetical protein TREMEDRAFT_65028 [Tremella mesenterica DSM 1558]
MISQHPGKLKECDFPGCEERVVGQSALDRHKDQLSHWIPGGFKCKQCSAAFDRPYQLSFHRQETHGVRGLSSWSVCTMCEPHGLLALGDMRVHKHSVHGEEYWGLPSGTVKVSNPVLSNPKDCTSCPASFQSSTQWKKHLEQAHTNELQIFFQEGEEVTVSRENENLPFQCPDESCPVGSLTLLPHSMIQHAITHPYRRLPKKVTPKMRKAMDRMWEGAYSRYNHHRAKKNRDIKEGWDAQDTRWKFLSMKMKEKNSKRVRMRLETQE